MKTFYISPDVLLTYIIGDDKATNKLIDFGNGVTSAYAFHEVISAMTVAEIKKHGGALAYLLQRIPIVDTKVAIGKATTMRVERRKQLRGVALGKRKDS